MPCRRLRRSYPERITQNLRYWCEVTAIWDTRISFIQRCQCDVNPSNDHHPITFYIPVLLFMVIYEWFLVLLLSDSDTIFYISSTQTKIQNCTSLNGEVIRPRKFNWIDKKIDHSWFLCHFHHGALLVVFIVLSFSKSFWISGSR